MEAFKLTESMEEQGFSGGTVMCSTQGHTFDIKKALDDHNGVISTDDPILTALLRNYSALESTDVPEDAEPVPVPGRHAGPATVAPPWTPQSGNGGLDPSIGSMGELPAVHSDAEGETSDDVAGDPAVADTAATADQGNEGSNDQPPTTPSGAGAFGSLGTAARKAQIGRPDTESGDND